jgi:hypothetical protein
MAGKRKTSAKKKAVPVRKKLSAEEKILHQDRLDLLRNAPVQMPKSVLSARADQESKLGTGVKCGRRTSYTPDRIEALLKNVRSGLPIMRACSLAAIPHSNLYDWMKRYSDLSEAIQQAESEYQAFALGTVNDGIANGDGHLAMKLLGARFSDEYATSRKVDVRSHQIHTTITPDQLAGLQSNRVETDVVSAVNLLGSEETDASPANLTQSPPDNDGSAENEPGGTPTTRGTKPHTPPRPKQSHTGNFTPPPDASSDTADVTDDADDGGTMGDGGEESDTTPDTISDR